MARSRELPRSDDLSRASALGEAPCPVGCSQPRTKRLQLSSATQNRGPGPTWTWTLNRGGFSAAEESESVVWELFPTPAGCVRVTALPSALPPPNSKLYFKMATHELSPRDFKEKSFDLQVLLSAAGTKVPPREDRSGRLRDDVTSPDICVLLVPDENARCDRPSEIIDGWSPQKDQSCQLTRLRSWTRVRVFVVRSYKRRICCVS